MAILGAHMSIAGGYYKAVEAAARLEMDSVQVFTKNNNQWRAKPMTDKDAELFRSSLADSCVEHTLSHTSYLLNLASPDEELCQRSIDGLVVELQRATFLGIPYVVLHPGSFTTSTESEGLERIIRSLDSTHDEVSDDSARVLLENTAGQGSNLGWDFQHLATILGGVTHPELLGVCFDTCHAFAAGYPLETPDEYEATMNKFDDIVGIERIRAFHLNDSKGELGSRKDRHEHIGQGALGKEAFRNLLKDHRFHNIPMFLETPKGDDDESGKTWDETTLALLRELVP